MVKLLLPFLGFYPAGSLVQLDNGEKAICLEPNTRNILRPAIAINGQAYEWLSTVAPSGRAFSKSVARVIGHHTDLGPYLPLIPNLQQTPT
jgi:hypothetical protein